MRLTFVLRYRRTVWRVSLKAVAPIALISMALFTVYVSATMCACTFLCVYICNASQLSPQIAAQLIFPYMQRRLLNYFVQGRCAIGLSLRTSLSVPSDT